MRCRPRTCSSAPVSSSRLPATTPAPWTPTVPPPTVRWPPARTPAGSSVQALLDLGHTGEAEQVSEELRRGRPATPETYHLVGEAWEAVGDLNRANRWLPAGSFSPRARRT